MSANKRVKEIRHTINLTQAKFASRIAISGSYLAGIESGEKQVNKRIIKLIGQEFGVDEHWFNTGEGSMFNDDVDLRSLKATSLFKMLDHRFQDFALQHLNLLVELFNSTSK